MSKKFVGIYKSINNKKKEVAKETIEDARKRIAETGEGTPVELFDYLCSRVEWGKTFLDNTGICCMNRLFQELPKYKEIIKLNP